jgi:hypothetical protein
MSTTATATRGQNGRGRLPAVRRDRRPALAALALLLVVGGALGSALVAYRSGDRIEVLVARDDIALGQQMTEDDFSVARVATDTAGVIDAAAVVNFVDSYATSRIPAGTLVNRNMFSSEDAVPDGAQLVGVVVDATRRPTEAPQEGDVVGVYYVSQGGQPVGTYAPGDPVVDAALVMGSSATSGDGLSLTLLVEDRIAGTVAEFAASGSLAVTVLPASAEPSVDSE